MHHLIPRHILSLLMVCAVPLSALDLQLHPKLGSSTSFSMSIIQRISFTGGNLMITKKDASTSSFAMNSMGFLNFTRVATELPLNSKLEINTYPNPEQELLHIDIQLIDYQSAKLEIINLNGKVVVQKLLYNSSNTISIAGLPKGMYFCRVQNGTAATTAKFIKQ